MRQLKGTSVIALSLLAATAGCAKGSASKSSSTPQPSTPGNPAAPTPGSPGTLDLGTVSLNIAALSSAPSFSQANVASASAAASSAQPGVLAVGSGLSLDDTATATATATTTGTGTATATGAPAYTSMGIMSGAPDAFTLTLLQVTLSTNTLQPGMAGLAQVIANGQPNPNTATTPPANPNGPTGGATPPSAGGPPPGGGTGGLALNNPPPNTNPSASGNPPANATPPPGGSAPGGSAPSGSSGQAAAVPVNLLTNAAGYPITVTSGSLDLGKLAGSGANFQIPAATYNSIILTFARQAKIQGCVTGTYQTGIGLTIPASGAGPHTYCTVPGYSTFDAGTTTASTFEVPAAQAQSIPFDLAPPSPNNPSPASPNDQVSIAFPISGGLDIKTGQTVDLSFVIDLNRMLRFYTGTGNAVSPGAPTNTAFFFTTIFPQSIYAFAGSPGRVYGYQVISQYCTKADYTPGSTACPPSQTGTLMTQGAWLTLITDPTGNPLVANLQPDDDNNLVIMKGRALPLPAGVTTPSIAAGTTAGMVDISYYLGSFLEGTIQNFDPKLEDVAVGQTMSGVTFDATTSPPVGSTTPGQEYQGMLYVYRGL